MSKTAIEVIAKHLTSNWSRMARESGAHVFREEADKLIRAVDAAGFVIVPKEPTDEQLNAALGLTDPSDIYRAMIDMFQPEHPY